MAHDAATPADVHHQSIAAHTSLMRGSEETAPQGQAIMFDRRSHTADAVPLKARSCPFRPVSRRYVSGRLAPESLPHHGILGSDARQRDAATRMRNISEKRVFGDSLGWAANRDDCSGDRSVRSGD